MKIYGQYVKGPIRFPIYDELPEFNSNFVGSIIYVKNASIDPRRTQDNYFFGLKNGWLGLKETDIADFIFSHTGNTGGTGGTGARGIKGKSTFGSTGGTGGSGGTGDIGCTGGTGGIGYTGATGGTGGTGHRGPRGFSGGTGGTGGTGSAAGETGGSGESGGTGGTGTEGTGGTGIVGGTGGSGGTGRSGGTGGSGHTGGTGGSGHTGGSGGSGGSGGLGKTGGTGGTGDTGASGGTGFAGTRKSILTNSGNKIYLKIINISLSGVDGVSNSVLFTSSDIYNATDIVFADVSLTPGESSEEILFDSSALSFRYYIPVIYNQWHVVNAKDNGSNLVNLWINTYDDYLQIFFDDKHLIYPYDHTVSLVDNLISSDDYISFNIIVFTIVED